MVLGCGVKGEAPFHASLPLFPLPFPSSSLRDLLAGWGWGLSGSQKEEDTKDTLRVPCCTCKLPGDGLNRGLLRSRPRDRPGPLHVYKVMAWVLSMLLAWELCSEHPESDTLQPA